MSEQEHTEESLPVEQDEVQAITIAAPSKEELKEQKRVRLMATAAGIFAEMRKRGTIVQDEGTRVFVPNGDQPLSPFPIEKGNAEFETFVHRCTGLTASEYDGRIVTDHVRMLARRAVTRRKVVAFSQFQESREHAPSVVLSDANGMLRVRAGAVERIAPETVDCYIESVGRPWNYVPLDAPQLAGMGLLYKHLFADSQSCAPESRVALAVTVPLFTLLRQMLDVRPILHFSGGPSSGKSFGADRFGYHLYGKTTLMDTTEAALKRDSDPFVILDDMERLPSWMKDHLRKSATGIKRMTVRCAKDAFQVEKSEPMQSIYIVTAIRIPTDSALLTRIWFFNYDKGNFRDEFKDERQLRQEILDNRDTLLSFSLQLLAETLRLHACAGLPDLSHHEPLPAPRTRLAQQLLLQCLRAYDQLSPGILNPEEEFKGFVQQQRREDKTRHGQSTDELTILDQIMEDMELERENGAHLVQELDSLPEGYQGRKVQFTKDGALVGSATALCELLLERARKQGIRLRSEMNAINVGRWLSSEVRDSVDFTAEECSMGTGNSKRNGWRIMRRPKP